MAPYRRSLTDFEAYIRGAFFGGFEDVAPSAPQTLLPLERFDYETLRRTPERISEFNAHRAVRVYVCENLHLPEGGYERASAQLLKALRDGNLDREQRLRFNRILSGMRSFERHLIYRSWGLSIFELASVVAQSYCSVSNKLMVISLEPVTLLGVAVVRTRRCEWRQKSLCRRESAGGWKRGHRRVARRCAYASVRESF